MRDVEVDEQSDAPATQFQVREQLCFVDRKDGFNRRHFDDHLVFDEQIDAVAEIDDETIVFDCKRFLGFESNAEAMQFVTKTHSIRPLKKAGPEL